MLDLEQNKNSTQPPRRFRLLIVEDDPERMTLFRLWLPEDVLIVWAKSAGVALGIIRRDSGSIYGGIMLDHDLEKSVITDDDLMLSGTQVTDLMIQCISPDVPILVHSVNPSQGPRMVSQLKRAGFWVEFIPMHYLSREKLEEWLTEVLEIWESIHN